MYFFLLSLNYSNLKWIVRNYRPLTPNFGGTRLIGFSQMKPDCYIAKEKEVLDRFLRYSKVSGARLGEVSLNCDYRTFIKTL